MIYVPDKKMFIRKHIMRNVGFAVPKPWCNDNVERISINFGVEKGNYVINRHEYHTNSEYDVVSEIAIPFDLLKRYKYYVYQQMYDWYNRSKCGYRIPITQTIKWYDTIFKVNVMELNVQEIDGEYGLYFDLSHRESQTVKIPINMIPDIICNMACDIAGIYPNTNRDIVLPSLASSEQVEQWWRKQGGFEAVMEDRAIIKDEEYLNYIKEHINNVNFAYQSTLEDLMAVYDQLTKEEKEMVDVLSSIGEDIKLHDMSKYSDEEFGGYRRHFYPAMGEEENKEEYDKAWEHHYQNNPHHWEYFVNPETKTVRYMPPEDTWHMYCDWAGMSIKFPDNGNPKQWFEKQNDIQLNKNTRIYLNKIFNLVDKYVYTAAVTKK